jgi:two-component system LytT family response regulator/two-component system response regulator LytT
MALPLTALIIDDEPLARQELQYLLDDAGDVSVLAQGTNGIEAVDLIRTHKPDVIFLDVRMPGLDGFAVLKKVLALERKMKLPQVVFATAFDQYAVKAFEVNAVDYLLKPFDSKRVKRTLEKVRARVSSGTEQVAEGPGSVSGSSAGGEAPSGRVASRVAGAEAKLDALLRMVEEQAAMVSGSTAGATSAASAAGLARSGKVVVRAQSRLLLVNQKDLCFATIEEGRISVVTKTLEGDSNCRTLEELTDQLDPEQFWRVHRSFVVNIQHIREVVPWFKSSYQLRMDDRQQTEVPVSRSQTKRLRELFNL